MSGSKAAAPPPTKPLGLATGAAGAAASVSASGPAAAGSSALPPTGGASSSSQPSGSSSATPNQLQLAANCHLCQASGDLYGSPCLHMTLCRPCGKSMAENSRPCTECGKPVLRLVMEYTVRTSANLKNYFVGNFRQGLPGLSRKTDVKWSMWREGAQGRQLTDAARERYKSKPWILEDSAKKHQYQGVPESQHSSYFIFIRRDKDFIALPMASWYNFRPMQTYRMLTLEEAEQQMANRRKAFQKIMMKPLDASGGDGDALAGSGVGGRRFKGESDDDGSPRGDGDSDDDEARRKEKFGAKRGNKDEKGDDGEDAADDPEIDLDDDEPEKGDDWEHEETFTDDDDAPGNEPEEKEEERPPTPPPEIKEESEEEEQEGEGLSKSGKELKKLLGKSVFSEDGVEEQAVPQEEEDDDEDVDLDKEDEFSPVFCIRKKDVKEEAGDGEGAATGRAGGGGAGAAASGAGGGGRGGGKKRKGPEKGGDAAGAASTGPAKKAKSETGTNREGGKGRGSKTAGTAAGASGDAASAKVASVAPKAEPGTPAVAGRVPTGHGADAAAGGKAAPAATATKPAAKLATPGGTTAGESASGAITEEEVRRVLSESGPIKSAALITKFKKQIKDPEERAKFAAILKRISKIQETPEGKFITLRTNAAAKKS